MAACSLFLRLYNEHLRGKRRQVLAQLKEKNKNIIYIVTKLWKYDRSTNILKDGNFQVGSVWPINLRFIVGHFWGLNFFP